MVSRGFFFNSPVDFGHSSHISTGFKFPRTFIIPNQTGSDRKIREYFIPGENLWLYSKHAYWKNMLKVISIYFLLPAIWNHLSWETTCLASNENLSRERLLLMRGYGRVPAYDFLGITLIICFGAHQNILYNFQLHKIKKWQLIWILHSVTLIVYLNFSAELSDTLWVKIFSQICSNIKMYTLRFL